MRIWISIAVMAIVTYLIRMLPFTLLRKPIRSRFLRSLLYYIPYAVLAAMTFPAILFSTGRTETALAGTGVALLLAFLRMPMIVVAVAAAVAAYVVGLF